MLTGWITDGHEVGEVIAFMFVRCDFGLSRKMRCSASHKSIVSGVRCQSSSVETAAELPFDNMPYSVRSIEEKSVPTVGHLVRQTLQDKQATIEFDGRHVLAHGY